MHDQFTNLPFMQEPYENALKVIRIPEHISTKIPLAILQPGEPLHSKPPPPEHKFSHEANYLLDTAEPIDFFD